MHDHLHWTAQSTTDNPSSISTMGVLRDSVWLLLVSAHLVTGYSSANASLIARQNVNTHAAIGDSYASGPSAGKRVGDVKACRRFDDAYGPRLARDTDLWGSRLPEFGFIACAGSKTRAIITGETKASKPSKWKAE